MKLRVMIFTGVMLLIPTTPVLAGTYGDDCRAYARAIYAVAEARDNLDEPSWDELLKLHPILTEIEKNEGSGFGYAQLISLRFINKIATPKTLMTHSYESCLTSTGLCMLYNQGCGPDSEK